MSASTHPCGTPSLTPAGWAERQLPHLDTLLLEQAHLEKKAAAAALAFLFRLPTDASQNRQLSALAREELVHFERTLKLLELRGIAFAPQEASGYAEKLKKAVRRDATRLGDELLVAAIIEHRSHERMTLMARATAETEPVVSRFYSDLCPAEERHEQLYLDLATSVVDAETVRTRHAELLAHEARVLAELPACPRLHGGLREAVSR
ncbi:MAG TPA: tRNA-(ms[2]io[6]A)-hydroxylase [Planctomycetes bacterium]|nr:tRNA-(ms[2]io[6]A)-hydroxylase [Planctomycetota bacterium]